MPIVFYDSLKEFSDSLPARTKDRYENNRDPWAGNLTYSEAREALWQGDPTALDISDKLLEKLEADGIELAQSYWDTDRTGFIPCIPSFLAGSPESMRRLVEFQSESAPIKIFTDVCLSAGFSESKLARRGATILALVRKLQAIRPVELYLFASMAGSDAKDGYGECAIPVIQIATSPLDLTSVSFAMANAAFLRRLCFVWGNARGFGSDWAWHGQPESNREKLTKFLNINPQDMLIDGAYLQDKLMSEPLEWVNDQVKRYASVLDN